MRKDTMNMAKERKRIYAVATAHLDTSWGWDFETTVRDYLPITLYDNFVYFTKYPEYVFSFEGSYRYELMEEYYPEAFRRLKEHVAAGRWCVAGSSYENGDVNVPSPEALFRNILYGNDYFDKKFGVRSCDIYLPDCFGFGWALPSVAAHAGLRGFTTQKLGWSCAYGIPFDLGVWRGPDGGEIYASLDARDYNQTLKKDVRKNGIVMRKLRSNSRKYDLPFTYVLHGIGDRGGAPREKSVETVCKAARKNEKSNIEVAISSTDRVFRDMDAQLSTEQKAKLPVWNNELVMTDHGVGGYTSRAIGKRWNRRSEQLADSAERINVLAKVLGAARYPQEQLDTCWKRFIAHQFHDDLPGTSVDACYKRNWNDYVVSMGGFAAEICGGMGAVLAGMDTSFVSGRAIAVYNPCAYEAVRTVTFEISGLDCEYIRVLDSNGDEVPSQIVSRNGDTAEICLSAPLAPVSVSIFDLQASEEPCKVNAGLSVSQRTLENGKYKVSLDESGDIASIFDKVNSRELLEEPIRMALFNYEGSLVWPAWEMEYKESAVPAREYATNPKFEVVANGASKVAIKTVRTAGKSTFIQITSLTAGGESVEVYNEIEWRDLRTMLKTQFPLRVSNPKASFDLGLGIIERGNMIPSLYEVPAQQWADITSPDNSFGISVLSDSKYGWDKPADNTLRLTGVHSPRSPWRGAQHMMEFGLNRYSFAICSHTGEGRDEIQQNAAEFNQPASAFETDIHPGSGRTVSLCSVSPQVVLLRAVKKAQNSDEIVIRVNEGTGNAVRDAKVSFLGGIISAREIYASELDREGKAFSVVDGELVFDLDAFEVRSFAIQVNEAAAKQAEFMPVELPYDTVGATENEDYASGGLVNGVSVPMEQYPCELNVGGVNFKMSRDCVNMMRCRAQSVEISQGADKICIIAASMNGDMPAEFDIDGEIITREISDMQERVGAWDLYAEGECGYIKKTPVAWNSTHTHGVNGDIYAKQLYFFRYDFPVNDKKVFTFPDNDSIIILSACAIKGGVPCEMLTPQFDRLEKRECTYTISARDQARAKSKKHLTRSRRKFAFGFLSRNIKKELNQLK